MQKKLFVSARVATKREISLKHILYISSNTGIKCYLYKHILLYHIKYKNAINNFKEYSACAKDSEKFRKLF